MLNDTALLTRTKTARSCFEDIFLSIVLLGFSSYVNAGWFDYDTRDECMEKEPGKLMSRMINPFPKSRAFQVAREVCKTYPNDYEFKLHSMSDSELVKERKNAVARDAEIMLNRRRNDIRRDKLKGRYDPNMQIDFRMLRTKYVDAEIKRRK